MSSSCGDVEMCVGDLVSILDLPQPTVSRHLAYLHPAGLLITRKNGLWIFYSLALATTVAHEKLLECLGACFTDVPELKRDQRKAVRVPRSGGCCPLD